jgi:hypothetical protein
VLLSAERTVGHRAGIESRNRIATSAVRSHHSTLQLVSSRKGGGFEAEIERAEEFSVTSCD